MLIQTREHKQNRGLRQVCSWPRSRSRRASIPNFDDLRSAIDSLLDGVSPAKLRASVADLSGQYRSGVSDASPKLDDLAVLAYTAYRLPATFSACSAVLREVRRLVPDFHPTTLLDVGSGPGTVGLAVESTWGTLGETTFVERNASMTRVGRLLREAMSKSEMRKATWLSSDILAAWAAPPADLVSACYVFGEIAEVDRRGVTDRLWSHCLGVCVIVEPGTPRGYRTIRSITEDLVALGARIIAPFPPDWDCLQGPGDWTHFSVRVPRTSLHRALKGADLSYEDEKYCYVVASRFPSLPIGARVLRHPQVKEGHVRLILGTAQGIQTSVVPRSRREAYRLARTVKWGDALTQEDLGVLIG